MGASKPIFRRDLRHIDLDRLFIDANEIPWHDIYSIYDTDDKTEAFTQSCKILLDNHAPMRSFTPLIETDVPWMNKEIKILIFERDMTKREWRRTRSEDTRSHFKTLRNRVNQLLKNGKKDYYEHKFASTSNCSELWRNIRSLGINCKQSQDPLFTADDFNNYLVSHVPSQMNHSSSVYAMNPAVEPFYFRNVTSDEVVSSIYEVRSKAVGEDDIPYYNLLSCYY